MKKLSAKDTDLLFWAVIALIAVSGGMLLAMVFAGQMIMSGQTTVSWSAWFLASLAAVVAIVWRRKPATPTTNAVKTSTASDSAVRSDEPVITTVSGI